MWSPSDRLYEVTIPSVAGFERSHFRRALFRSVATTTVLLVVYYVAPIEQRPHQSIVWRVAVALALFVAVLAIEIRAIQNSDQPMLRAGVSLATIGPLFLLMFAWIYLTMSRSDPGYFSVHLDRTESLYFTVTVFSTVGFGDITPQLDIARLVTMVQMIADLVVVAVVVRLIFSAASRGQAAQHQEPNH